MTTKHWILGGAAVAAVVVAGFAYKARAADLGGKDGVADLEERVAELEATVARKGNRKVKLTISGQISKALLWTDNTGLPSDNKLRVIDNGNSGTRVRLQGEATVSPGMKAGFVFEYAFDETRGLGLGPVVGPVVQWLDGTASLRRSAVYLDSATLGKVTIGKYDMATDLIVDIDISNSGLASRALSVEPLWSYSGISGLPVVGGNLLNPMPFADLHSEVVRYDSPRILGGIELSASWAGGATLTGEDAWDAALRWSGEFSGVRAAFGAGYRVEKFTSSLLSVSAPDQKTVSGSGSLMHMASGIFVTVAAADQKDNLIFGDIRTWHAKVGWQKNVMGPGATTLYAEYADHKIHGTSSGMIGADIDSSFIGAGVVQAIDAAALDLFISGRQYESDVLHGNATTVLGGARIKF